MAQPQSLSMPPPSKMPSFLASSSSSLVLWSSLSLEFLWAVSSDRTLTLVTDTDMSSPPIPPTDTMSLHQATSHSLRGNYLHALSISVHVNQQEQDEKCHSLLLLNRGSQRRRNIESAADSDRGRQVRNHLSQWLRRLCPAQQRRLHRPLLDRHHIP